MNIDFLKKRIDDLTKEHEKVQAKHSELLSQAEQAKLHGSMVLGHLNEARFQLNELLKTLEDRSSQGESNGEVNNEEAK